MAARIGLECKMYFNVQNNSVPSWTELDIARDVTVGVDKGKGDVSKRGGGGFKATRGTLIGVTISFTCVTDPTNSQYNTLQNYFLNRNAVQWAVLTGTVNTNGTVGWKAGMEVMKFEDKQPLDGANETSVELEITDFATNPSWYTYP